MAIYFDKIVGIQNGQRRTSTLLCTPKKIDEVRYEDTSDVTCIKVESDCANVTIAATDNDTLGANLTGDISSNGEITLEAFKKGKIITVEVKHTGTIIKGELKLYLGISKKMFEKIKVNGSSSTIFVEKGIQAKLVELTSTNGNITFLGDSANIEADTTNGSVDLRVDAKSDVRFTAESVNGNIDVRFKNISECRVNASTVNGRVQKHFKCDGAYKVSGHASTVNGNVILQ